MWPTRSASPVWRPADATQMVEATVMLGNDWKAPAAQQ